MGLKLGVVPEKTFKQKSSLLAAISCLTLALTGCTSLPQDAPTLDVNYQSCLITQSATDAMGINEVADYAVKQAVVTYGVKRAVMQTKASKFASGVKTLVSKGCDLVVVSGRNFGSPLGAVVAANPEVNFLYIADIAQPKLVAADLSNLVVYQIDMYEAGLLAGHLAASMSEQHTLGILCTPVDYTKFLAGIRAGVSRHSVDSGSFTEIKVGELSGTMSSMRIAMGCKDELQFNGLADYSVDTRVIGFGLDLYNNTDLVVDNKKFVAATVIPNLAPRILEIIASDLEGDFIGGTLGSTVGNYGNGGLLISAEHEVPYPVNELKKLEQLAQDYEVTLK